mmetsp:Transcript_3008/g.7072  ORF Transcript_3008/g.7072 Transcript_3008/m.7072 type:complete len:564 (+) Transcript_3008:91-1782(+)|eukprot:CAMPEP_0113619308 /NCGR_PEP_ID=MMETSP0017_2-20120614/9802_1 /TAXON_ID=2856 /ORGANISM="Cylindrotheca closterium" /LENGTH=563 /DNA_ID=CAMNT_0000528877 /DNA_START=91 /DNA_END=1782 /DNA_ORIENTATION=+ /assembly_acc=CAM_ASM_000147
MPPREELTEPLLSSENDENNAQNDLEAAAAASPIPGACCSTERTAEEQPQEEEFSVRTELWEMASLGLPLGVSFFCRMFMASTDSAFVGHINDGQYTAEVYLAAAVLSDMCIGVFVTPPLAFNQVLNGLVGQAMGSGNPKMAGIWLQQSMFWLAMSMLPFLIPMFYVEDVLLALDFSKDVAKVAGTYAKFNIVWPIPNGLYQCMRFYFQAQGMPRPAMYNNIVFLFVNALLNWIFVFGGPFKHWNGLGFIGAAISLSISRTSQSVVYYIYMFVIKKNHLNTWPDDGWSFKHHTLDRTKEFMKQSLPNIGTLLFQCAASQATTVLVGRLGEGPIAASSAISTVSYPWSGTLSATCTTISGVRTGFHMGRGKANAAKQSTWLVLYVITVVNIIAAAIFIPFGDTILKFATNDKDVLSIAGKLIPALLVGTYLNLIVSNITSGVFSGMGRPIIATVLSFGLELPMSIGGVAVYILVMHGNLLGVYWWTAISGGLEVLIVMFILLRSDWYYWAEQAQLRQEAGSSNNEEGEGDGDENGEAPNEESGEGGAATTEESVDSDENSTEDN